MCQELCSCCHRTQCRNEARQLAEELAKSLPESAWEEVRKGFWHEVHECSDPHHFEADLEWVEGEPILTRNCMCGYQQTARIDLVTAQLVQWALKEAA